MAATFIRTPKQPTSPNEHRTPGLSRHLWSAAPAQPLLNLGPAVLSRDPSPIRNAAAPPMPHRLDSKKKKRLSAQRFADTQHGATHHGMASLSKFTVAAATTTAATIDCLGAVASRRASRRIGRRRQLRDMHLHVLLRR